ncbi:MAG TPA: protein-tyrosine phosphatase family protein, partial [Polyangiales bacterium]
RQSEHRAVVLVTHQQQHAVRAGGITVLLAGGRIVEQRPTADFFASPATEHGRSFVRSGTCMIASPMALPEDLAEGVEKPPTLPPAARETSRRAGPRGFYWLKPGQLGGLPRPGIINSLDADLEGLRDLGVDILVSLEESPTVDTIRLQQRGIIPHYLPIVDMGAPSVGEALSLAAQIDTWIRGGSVVAVHCKAGLGRTGTILACQLIYDGETAVGAVERVRQINPRWIQSERQVEFIRELWQVVTKQREGRCVR